MPVLTIQGQKFNRVIAATVEITHGDTKEARQVPLCQFVITLPLDRDTTLASWALAPQGPDRYKMVELQIMDRSNTINHIWTLHKAYVHHYEEREAADGSGYETEMGNYYEIVVRGTLMHNNMNYDGKNLLQIDASRVQG